MAQLSSIHPGICALTKGSAAKTFEIGLLLILILCCAYVARLGFDLTDESYYVFCIYYAGVFQAAIHSFGMLLAPFLYLFGRSLVYARLFGIFSLIASGLILGLQLHKYYQTLHRRAGSDDPFGIDLTYTSAIFSLSYYGVISVMTPSYNLFSNVAGCLVAAGSLGWMLLQPPRANTPLAQESKYSSLYCSILVGIGGCIACLAKPTFALLCAVAIAAQLVTIWRRLGIKTALSFAVPAAIFCIIPVIVLIHGTLGIEHTISIFQKGQQTLNFGNKITALPMKTIMDILHAPRGLLVAVLVFIALVTVKRFGSSSSMRWLPNAAVAVLCIELAYFIYIVGRSLVHHESSVSAAGAPVLMIALGIVGCGLVRQQALNVSLASWIPVIITASMPFAISFGTANGLVAQTAYSVFFTLIALCIAANLLFRGLVPMIVRLACLAYTSCLLFWSFQIPYGLPAPFWQQNESIHLSPQGDVLYVDHLTARYVSDLRSIAADNRLTPDVPIIDLSGGGPGTALFLNANAPYYPWIVHAFGKGSEQLADTVWNSLSVSDRKKAWIILPAHEIFAKTNVMQYVNSHKNDYRMIGRTKMTFWHQSHDIQIWAQR